MVFGVVSGITGIVSPLVGNLVGGIGNVAQSIVFSPYSRSQENEADEVGQEIAARAGWDPAALSVFLATLEREVQLTSKGEHKPSFFDSHPATPDRVAKTAAHAKQLHRADQAPLSASRDVFLERLDGMVVGPRAANGIFHGDRFLQPDLNFQVRFPENWPHENSPQKIIAVAPDKEAAVVVGVVAKGNDPMDGARAVEKAAKTEIVSKTQRGTVGDLPAAHTRIHDGNATVDVTWIAYEGLVYQVIGMASKKKFDTLLPIFTSVVQSFKPLTAAERASIKENRIRLITAKAGETIGDVAARSGTAWTKEEMAVANGMTVTTALTEGQLVKVAMTEPYESRRRR